MRKVGTMLALLGVLAFIGIASTPASAVTCSGGATMTIDLADGESITLSLSGANDPRTIEVAPADPSCGGFDTSTVSTILVDGTAGNQSVTIDQAGSAPFPHQNTDSIDLALGGGSDVLVIDGQPTDDTIGLGKDGVSLDAGGSPEVTGLGSIEIVSVSGAGGNDTISAREGNALGGDLSFGVTLDGGAGNDALTGGDGNDVVGGGSGTDTLRGSKGADRLMGGDGDDLVSGGGGKDRLSGGAAGDRLKGGGEGDKMDGGDGNDTMSGGGGPDAVNGGDRNDRLEGGAGDDDVKGEPGRDQLSGGKGEDHCLGGPDPDSITGCEHGHP
jgi:Ca2+-binding RTX toxin-like protein